MLPLIPQPRNRRFEVRLSAPRALILCVDDEELPLTLRKLVLEKQGYEVVPARSAAVAARLIETRMPDLVLTDQLMPGGNGSELARWVKQAHPTLPVVLISGVNEIPEDASQVDLFISKVEGPVRMCEKIEAVLAHGRADGADRESDV